MSINPNVRGTAITVNPRKLNPHPRNTNLHSDSQIDLICGSIKQFGFVKPVIIDESDVILAGHGAVLAALKLELPKIPARKITGLDEIQKRAFVIADNRLAELSKWDWELLTVELDELQSADMDLAPLGFKDFGKGKTHRRGAHDVVVGEGRFLLQIEFENETELQRMFEELKGRGIENMKVLE